LRDIAVTVPEDAETGQGDISRRHVHILVFQITGTQRLVELDVVVRTILVTVALVYDQCPFFSVFGSKNTVLVINIHGTVVLNRFMVVEVQLHGTYILCTAQVYPGPFAGVAGTGCPGGCMLQEWQGGGGSVGI
jgi:hypothetical protein